MLGIKSADWEDVAKKERKVLILFKTPTSLHSNLVLFSIIPEPGQNSHYPCETVNITGMY